MINSRANHLLLTAFFLVSLPITSTPGQALQSSDTKPKAEAPSSTVENVNAQLVAARLATKEKRYADSEALMLKLTAGKPELIAPWVELGLAQLGEQKFPEARASFEVALGLDPASIDAAHANDFYKPDKQQVTYASRNTAGGFVINPQSRTPDIKGICWSSLGEIYLRTNHIPEAQKAYDEAVKANPAKAALFLGNETIISFQTGNTDTQLAAADKAIAVDPSRAMLYYFKGQALASKATADPFGKMILPPGCAEAYQKYLQLDPKGQFANDAKGVLTAAGIPTTGK